MQNKGYHFILGVNLLFTLISVCLALECNYSCTDKEVRKDLRSFAWALFAFTLLFIIAFAIIVYRDNYEGGNRSVYTFTYGSSILIAIMASSLALECVNECNRTDSLKNVTNGFAGFTLVWGILVTGISFYSFVAGVTNVQVKDRINLLFSVDKKKKEELINRIKARFGIKPPDATAATTYSTTTLPNL